MLHRRNKFAKPLLVATLGLLWIASTPYFVEGALHLLEAQTAALDDKPHATCCRHFQQGRI